jgi:hypothetical protein
MAAFCIKYAVADARYSDDWPCALYVNGGALRSWGRGGNERLPAAPCTTGAPPPPPPPCRRGSPAATEACISPPWLPPPPPPTPTPPQRIAPPSRCLCRFGLWVGRGWDVFACKN